jgi:type VI secretion system protein ImpA
VALEALLTPVSGQAPAGPDLKGTLEYAAFENLARGNPGRQTVGGVERAPEEPAWPDVADRATQLLGKTKDLRLAVHLAKAWVRMRGWVGLADGLRLCRLLLDAFWENVHPGLDREDNDDPTLRVNSLVELAQDQLLLAAIRGLPLVDAPKTGRFGLRDLVPAAGGTLAPDGQRRAGIPPIVEAAFVEVPLETLQATATAVRAALDEANAIERVVTEKVGVGQSVNLTALRQLLADADRVLTAKVAARVPVKGPAEGDDMNGKSNGESGVEKSGRGSEPLAVGAIRNRADVVAALDALCAYYQVNEPSSPIPLLLQRARRLVPMDFMALLKELTPQGVAQMELIRGPEDKRG